MRTFMQAEWLRIQEQRVHDIESCAALVTEWPETEPGSKKFCKEEK